MDKDIETHLLQSDEFPAFILYEEYNSGGSTGLTECSRGDDIVKMTNTADDLSRVFVGIRFYILSRQTGKMYLYYKPISY